MKEQSKKLFLCLSVCSLLVVGGCQKEEEAPEKPKEEEIALVTNTIYEAPSAPTQEQVKVYNELSNALNANAQEEEIAKLVAVNFAYEFFSLYNKTGKDDVGGLTFLPEDEREDFKSYAEYRYYNNYQTVISQYGKEDLPNVVMHEVVAVDPAQFNYNQLVYDGYVVELTLKYADSKLPANGLKTTMNVNVINNNGIYQVIAVEDVPKD